jgi:ubiquinone biosynthesis protein UbiJ
MAAESVKDVFERHMPEKLRGKPDVVAKINAVYQFNISGPSGGQWSVDCTQPGGLVAAGTAANARCTVQATDADFLNIVNGKLNPQMAFMSGKLRIQGDMALAMKLQQIL